MNALIKRIGKTRSKWKPNKIELYKNFVSDREYQLILDELSSIIYSETTKVNSLQTNEVPHKQTTGGTDVA